MNRFEDELREALRRKEPSPDFSDRLMARIAQLPIEDKQERQGGAAERDGWWKKFLEFFRPPQLRWAMAGAVVCLLIFAAFGVYRYYEHQRAMEEIAEGQRAKEQVILAMKIASKKLNLAQKKIHESSENKKEKL